MKSLRLLLLAEHLEHGKLGHNAFDYRVYHSVAPCGSSGCAIGECPTAFPEQWMMDEETSHPLLKDLVTNSAFQSAMIFFGINDHQASILFAPHYGIGREEELGVTSLHASATKERVAAHIRKFVELNSDESVA